MKEKINTFKKYYQDHSKYFWIAGVVIIVGVYFVFSSGSKNTITVYPVTYADLKQTVLATGQVTSATDLNLSFPVSGIVETLPVSVGDKVSKGQILATLSNRSQYAALSDAKANYQKVIDGSSNEEIAVAQAALDSAKANFDNTQKVQDTLLDNAHRALLNADLTPTLTSGTTGTPPTITGTYAGSDSGTYVITPHAIGNNGYFSFTGLENGNGTISTTAPVALGTKGLFIQFPTNFYLNTSNVWTITLPNTQSPDYLNAYNAYQNALKNHDSAISAAQAAVTEAQANLDLKKASATSADIAVAQAKVDQAEADYDNTLLYAPTSGTIVHVDTKIGESVDSKTESIVLQDVDNLYVEANVNETSIAKIALQQPVAMTLDAFGPDTIFTGNVIHIDPSSTTSDGVVNYVIKVSIADSGNNKVRPGMNANMVITAWAHPHVIVIPKVAITTKADGSYVDVVTDDKNDTFETRKITTGMTGDGNLVEVLSGLADGEKIAITHVN